MEKVTEHYAQFYFPGMIVADTSNKKVESRDPYKVVIPKGAYCFRLFSRDVVIDGKKRYEGENYDYTGMFYRSDAVVMSLKEVKAHKPEERILISNMEGNGWNRIIFSKFGDRLGWPQPFEDGDTVL